MSNKPPQASRSSLSGPPPVTSDSSHHGSRSAGLNVKGTDGASTQISFVSKDKEDKFTPLPFARINQDAIGTLHDLLRVQLPPCPPPYKLKSANQTRAPTNADIDLSPAKQLAKVVFLPSLVPQLLEEASQQLCDTKIDWQDPEHVELAHEIHPHMTARHLPQVINGEPDIDTWTGAVIFRPALAALRVVRTGSMAYDYDNQPTFLASAPFGDIVPDMVFIDGGSLEDPDHRATLEIKTPNASRSRNTHVMQKLVQMGADVPEGTAMRFIWPENSTGTSKQTKILVQIWSQLLKYNCHRGVLSSYEHTMLFARGKGKHGDTLYISSLLNRNSCPMYAVYAWFANASNRLSPGIDLPPPLTDWWSTAAKKVDHTRSGIVLATEYSKYEAPRPLIVCSRTKAGIARSVAVNFNPTSNPPVTPSRHNKANTTQQITTPPFKPAIGHPRVSAIQAGSPNNPSQTSRVAQGSDQRGPTTSTVAASGPPAQASPNVRVLRTRNVPRFRVGTNATAPPGSLPDGSNIAVGADVATASGGLVVNTTKIWR